MLATFALADLLPVNGGDGSKGFSISGNRAVSDLGDINGDGFADFAFGRAVFFGAPSGIPAELDPVSLDGSNGFTVTGAQSFRGVRAAGDFNNDGFHDFTVLRDNANAIVFGRASFSSAIDTTALGSDDGVFLTGADPTSLSGVGDLNGDGYADIAGGKDVAGVGNDLQGFVIYGRGNTGVLQSVDVTAVSVEDGFYLDLNLIAAGPGGDVNGDGIGDFVVNALDLTTGSSISGAHNFVFFGSESLPSLLDPLNLNGGNGFRLTGIDGGIGRIASAGDFNNDGFDDILAGDNSEGFGGAGEAYVIYGSDADFPVDLNVDSLSSLNGGDGSTGFTIRSSDNGSFFGAALDAAGDVNGDGFDDLLVGAPRGSNFDGDVYLILGSDVRPSTDVTTAALNLDSLVLRGLRYVSAVPLSNTGTVVSRGGDINGDGYDDLMIRSGAVDGNRQWVVYGSDLANEVTQLGGGTADVFSGTPEKDIIIAGSDHDVIDNIGANDVVRGGEGDDLLTITALDFGNIRGGSGQDTVVVAGGLLLDFDKVRGRLAGIERIDLRPDARNFLAINSRDVRSLSDNSNTLIVEAHAEDSVYIGHDWTLTGAEMIDGADYNVYEQGTATVKVSASVVVNKEAVYELDSLFPAGGGDGAEGFTVQAGGAFAGGGRSVASAGDINDDGFEDFIVGADLDGPAQEAAYVVFGKAAGFSATFDATLLDGANGFRIDGSVGGSLGASVAGGADVNGDEIDDLILGAPSANSDAGAAYVLFGKTTPFAAVVDPSVSLGVNGVRLDGRALDRAGASVAIGGDVNGDGIGDILVGAPGSDPNNVYLVYGQSEPFASSIDLSALDGQNGIVYFDTSAGSLGTSVDFVGDLNGDGFDDFVVGEITASGASSANFIFGQESLPAVVPRSFLDGDRGFLFLITENPSFDANITVAGAGDVNSDGFDDVVIGSDIASGGESLLIFGNASFESAVQPSELNGSNGVRFVGDGLSDPVSAASGLGDINGDGIADLAVNTFGKSHLASTHIVLGREEEWPAQLDVSKLHGRDGFRVDANLPISDIDFTTFTVENYPEQDGFPPAVWEPTKSTARISELNANAGANVFYGNQDILGSRIAGTLNPGSDDDMIGFVLGFNPGDVANTSADFLLLDWRSSTQAFNFSDPAGEPAFHNLTTGQTADVGMALSRVNGTPTADELWGHVSLAGNGAGGVTQLARAANLGETGYAPDTEVTFEIIYTASDVKVFVDGVEEFSETGAFGSGALGLYTLGQNPSPVFSDFTITPLAIDVGTNGMSVAAAGDVNGDGFEDMLFGAPAAEGASIAAGDAYVVFGFDISRSVDYQGDSAANILSGTTADEIFVGGQGSDQMRGFGRNDVFRGGEGDDVITVPSNLFHSVDGGRGFDVLNLEPFSTLDLTQIADNRIRGIEMIRSAGGGAVKLDLQEVLNLSDETNTLYLDLLSSDGVEIGPGWNTQGQIVEFDGRRYQRYTQGAAQLLLGATNTSAFDLSLLEQGGIAGAVFRGDSFFEEAGISASGAGDVNGDGFDDFLIGAETGLNGKSYLVYGTQHSGLIELEDIAQGNASLGTVFFGGDAGSGFSVSGAGDFNGDGFGDLLIGSNTRAVDELPGAAYLIYGSANGLGAAFDLDLLGTLNGDPGDGVAGFYMRGIDLGDGAGLVVNSAGDVNGDGYDDIIVAAPLADHPAGRSAVGEYYVVFGRTDQPAEINLETLDGTDGYAIRGIDQFDATRGAAASAGDVNGDGYDDMVFGAERAFNGEEFAGEAYLVFGHGGSYSPLLELESLTAWEGGDGSQGVVLRGVRAEEAVGYAVSSAGDINGDGLDDVLLGAPFASPSGKVSAGAAYVVYGSNAGFPAEIRLDSLDGSNGFIIEGALGDVDASISGFIEEAAGAAVDLFLLDGDEAGTAVGPAGDFNGDGFDDLLVGAPDASPESRFFGGQAYIVLGSPNGLPAVLPLETLDGLNGAAVVGADGLFPDNPFGDAAGQAVSAAGDINGDGFHDFLVASPNATITSRGEVSILYGGNLRGDLQFIGGDLDDLLIGDDSGNAMIGGRGNDLLRGFGGPDALSGGQGNDLLEVSDLNFIRVDGGTGADSLRFNALGVSIDLATIADNRIQDIEILDLQDGSSQLLTLSLHEVLALSSTSNTVTVYRDAIDTVNTGSGWTPSGTELIGDDSFDKYLQGAGTLFVQRFSGLGGDYDQDGRVDARDFLKWQRQFGHLVTPASEGDGDGSGVVDGPDLAIWEENFGTSAAVSAAAAAALPSEGEMIQAAIAWQQFGEDDAVETPLVLDLNNFAATPTDIVHETAYSAPTKTTPHGAESFDSIISESRVAEHRFLTDKILEKMFG